MAYDNEDLLKKALKAIAAHKLCFITEVPPFIGIAQSTFYDKEMEKSEEIKEALRRSRIESVVRTRNKWEESENATLQVARMKLICSEEEAHRLNGSKREVKNEIIDHNSIIEELESDG